MSNTDSLYFCYSRKIYVSACPVGSDCSYMSPRDIDHGKNGSVFAVNVFFGNNAETFVEGILLVATYGKKFIEKDNADFSEVELKNLVFEELFPYYQRLLEAELGMLYLKYEREN